MVINDFYLGGSTMKRSNQKIQTTHSKILRFMRVSRGFSMRGASKEIGLSATTVNHVENGRMDLSDRLIGRFIKAYGYNLREYNDYLKGKESIPFNYKEECISLIKSMDNAKLKAIHGLLSNF